MEKEICVICQCTVNVKTAKKCPSCTSSYFHKSCMTKQAMHNEPKSKPIKCACKQWVYLLGVDLWEKYDLHYCTCGNCDNS